jgi:TfoX/Sxy family transcriptional regulator of competence genes
MDQLADLGAFETKSMFGGTALLIEGKAFAKVKNGELWLKVGDANRTDFEDQDMPQYRYGKDNARKLNFFKTPTDVLEDADKLVQWASKSVDAALNG